MKKLLVFNTTNKESDDRTFEFQSRDDELEKEIMLHLIANCPD